MGRDMLDTIERRFREAAPAVDFCSLRLVDERLEVVGVNRDVLDTFARQSDKGAMAVVHHGGGMGYAGTTDLSLSGF